MSLWGRWWLGMVGLVCLGLERRDPSGGWRLPSRRRRGWGGRGAMLTLFVGYVRPLERCVGRMGRTANFFFVTAQDHPLFH